MKKNDYKYKFSVVIPIYKVEKYLEETIKSILDQTIGFEENIQMILVNDGSPDNSESICLKYKNMYPNNIIYVKQKNAGVSAARNAGAKLVEGRYVNFLDSDDKWTLSAFEKISEYFNKNRDIKMVSCRHKYFEARNDYHILDYKYKKTKIVNLDIDYDYPQLNINPCVFHNEIIESEPFSVGVKYSEDSLFVNKILLKIKKYAVMSDVICLYRKRVDESSAIQNSHKSKDWYLVTPWNVYEDLFLYSIELYNEVLPFIQNVVMYDLQWRIKSASCSILSQAEKQLYFKQIKKLVEQIEDYIILDQRNISVQIKFFILNLKYKSTFNNKLKTIKNRLTFNNLTVLNFNRYRFLKINVLDIKNNKLKLFGTIELPYESKDFNFFFQLSNGEKIKIDYKLDENKILKLFDGTEKKLTYNFECEIPLDKKGNISAFVSYKNVNYRTTISLGRFAKLNKISKNMVYFTNTHILKISNNKIIYLPNKKRVIFKNELLFIKELIKHKKKKLIVYRVISLLYRLLLRKRKNDIWLISDRRHQAGDNGEAFFKYVVKEKNKNIKPYFLISKESTDFQKMKRIGNVIKYNSFKHKLLFLLSPYIISSHADDYVINPFGKEWRYFANYYDYKYIFLQHGITKDDLSNWLNKNNKNIHLFVTSTKDEYNSLLKGNYSYTKNEVKLTGLPRYDLLSDKKVKNKKTILIAPTWRRNLVHELDKSGKRPYNKDFIKSKYYIFYNNLINHKKLLNTLKKNNVFIKFVLHPTIIQQLSDFTPNEFVELKESVTYKEEFEKNSLLITDYSSVAFDFAYLKKPIIYSQFDKDVFFANHTYEEGYFSYEKHGFGDVLETVDEVVDKIEYYIKKDLKLENKYLKRIDNTYEFFDKNNCERVYNEIIKLQNNQSYINKKNK